MMLRLILAVAVVVVPAAAQAPSDRLYVLDSSTTLPGTGSGWDYAKFEPGTPRLFIARDRDGLTVFDVDARKMLATVANSTGANGPLLIPQVDRGYVAMTDGSLLSFRLKTLEPIARTPLAKDVGLNSAVHDPGTGRVHAITADGPKETRWFTLDAATGKLLSTKTFPFRKMDDPTSDGRGHLFAPVRHDRLILKLDAATLGEQARWTTPCTVSKVRFQPATNRILGACYGEGPKFFAMDAATGRTVASVPIGRGIDGLAIDEKWSRIITANGEDASLTVIAQDGPDRFRPLGTVSTRPNARMMTIDERTGKLFVIYADFTIAAAKPGEDTVRRYHPGSFTVLGYRPE